LPIYRILLDGEHVWVTGIRKPKRGDELEFFLSRMENPNHGVTVDDPQTGQGVVLRYHARKYRY
jgi:hypothetical protein